MIAQETITQVTDRADLVEVISEFLKLKKDGVNYKAPCPFHNEKSASFTVSKAKGIYKCFGCGKGGNSAVAFIMEHEKSTYPEAIKWLAAKYKVDFVEDEKTDLQKETQLEAESIYNINKHAAQSFQRELQASDIASGYFTERGLRFEIIQRFQLGYSADDYRKLYEELKAAGWSEDIILKSDIAHKKEGKIFDRFRDRIMFPIHSLTGRIVGFGGRVRNSDKNMAKYVNTAENKVYQKRDQLYGIFFAKQAIAKLKECLLVEGYMDVLSLHDGGVENVVASSGTSLTDAQIRMIMRFTTNLTLLFDGDAAGLKAAVRGMSVALKEGMSVKAVRFPAKEDPDSYMQKHGALAFEEYITTNKRDIVEYMLDGFDALSPEEKDETGKTLLGLIADMPTDNIFRVRAKIEAVAKRFKVPFHTIEKRVNELRAKVLPGTAAEVLPILQIEATVSRYLHELTFARVLMLHGHQLLYEGMYCCTFMMEQAGRPEKFRDELAKEIFLDYYRCLLDGELPDPDYFLNHSNEQIRDLAMNASLENLTVSEAWSAEEKLPEIDYRKEVRSTVSFLRIAKFKEEIVDVQQELAAAKDQDKIRELMKKDSDLKLMLNAECLHNNKVGSF